MTERKAIKILTMVEAHGELTSKAKEKAIEALEEIQQFQAIGTVEEFKALKEKNEPKSPLRIPTDDTCLYYELRCPSCNAYMSGLIEMHHCTCGQKLSWE